MFCTSQWVVVVYVVVVVVYVDMISYVRSVHTLSAYIHTYIHPSLHAVQHDDIGDVGR